MSFSLQRRGTVKKVSDLDVCPRFDSVYQVAEVATKCGPVCSVLVDFSPPATITHFVASCCKTYASESDSILQLISRLFGINTLSVSPSGRPSCPPEHACGASFSYP